MKKTIISLATASLIASSAMAADKGIDFTTTGQAVVYYQTAGQASAEMFDQKTSSANVGVQLNVGSNLGNGFTFGSQLTYLGTTGLEKNLVSNTRQVSAATNPAGSGLDALNATTNQLMLSKIFVAKTVANTTVKLGRQELPKSLSPLAFTEGWNVVKNTFDAVLVINSDLPKTTLVGAYVGRSTGHDLSSVNNLTVNGALEVNGAAYMLTAQNTALPMTTVTASYYALKDIDVAKSADAIWIDAKIADKSLPMGLKVALQGGMIMPELSALDDTTAFGIKASVAAAKNLKVCAAFSTVNDGTAKVVNTGTGVKTPLYTQMVANQGFISSDNNTYMLKGAYSLGDMGTVIAQGTYSTDNSDAELDSTDLELLYTTKVSGMNLLAAYVRTNKIDDKKAANNIVRVVARYAF